MEDLKNRSSISNSNKRKFLITVILFSLPILIWLFIMEFGLRKIGLEPDIKTEYIENNQNDIEVIILGSSQSERAINPEFLDYTAINISNSSQRIPENFKLLKAFKNKLPNLKLVVIEIPFDILHRNKNYTLKEVDQQNLIFYGVNTFERNIKPQDHLLYLTNPKYFWRRIRNNLLQNQIIVPNKHGFDTNKFFGSYQAKKHTDSLLTEEDIFIENVNNRPSFKKNIEILYELLEYCNDENLQVLIYIPPNHYKYNALRKKTIVHSRDSILEQVQKRYSGIKIFDEEENLSFSTRFFYNANHLNPTGAKKATKRLNRFLKNNYDL